MASKYAVDSIVAAQKAYLFKQLSSMEDLLKQQKISEKLTTYFEEYPRVRKFLDIVTETAKLHGFVETSHHAQQNQKSYGRQTMSLLSINAIDMFHS